MAGEAKGNVTESKQKQGLTLAQPAASAISRQQQHIF